MGNRGVLPDHATERENAAPLPRGWPARTRPCRCSNRIPLPHPRHRGAIPGKDTQSMLAAYVESPNFDDPLSALVVGERPDPVVPEGWSLVRIKAASLNRHDIWTLQGISQHPLTMPITLGCDGAGTLDDGSEVLLYPAMTTAGW